MATSVTVAFDSGFNPAVRKTMPSAANVPNGERLDATMSVIVRFETVFSIAISVKPRERTTWSLIPTVEGSGRPCDRSLMTLLLTVAVAWTPRSSMIMMPSELLSRISLPEITTLPVLGTVPAPGSRNLQYPIGWTSGLVTAERAPGPQVTSVIAPK